MMLSSKISRSLLLLDLGVGSIKSVLKRKCVGYLPFLLTDVRPSLLQDVFQEQVRKPIRGDFVNQVTQDLKDINVNLSFSQIAAISKEKFKSIVKLACQEACFKQLLKNKQNMSKGKEITYDKFQIQPYLKPGYGLNLYSMRKIYFMRCWENFLKSNFPSLFEDRKCIAAPVCNEMDIEKHI